jgi:hypothetical protein
MGGAVQAGSTTGLYQYRSESGANRTLAVTTGNMNDRIFSFGMM